MTHIENIPHILKYGITHHNSVNKNNSYISIGDNNLISKRDQVVLPNNRMLGDYIPFYFGARMPMLFVIKQGSNSMKYQLRSISSEEIVYCITSVQSILEYEVDFLFSNGHALSELTQFFMQSDVSNIEKLLDWEAINAKYWRDDNDLDLKRRKEAEFLIGQDLPVKAILGYAVYNVFAKQKLISLGIDKDRITIKPNYYF